MNPTISNISNTDDVYRFTLGGVNVSLANAIRRVCLSEIDTNVIRTEIYKDNKCNITVNTGRLHNEILKQRLSCIPIHMGMNELDILPEKYILEVDVVNDTDSTIYVTTEHFKIKNKTNGNYLTKEETHTIFPADKRTGYYIDFARLRPKISDTIPGEQLKLTAEFSIACAKEDSAFNVVSKCAYGNTPDIVAVNEQWEMQAAKLRSQDVPTADIEYQKRNFYILDAQRSFIDDSFDFAVQSVGVFDNIDIVKKANEILMAKFSAMIEEIDSDTIQILNSETTMENSYDIILVNEDYTMGKVIEFILYDRFYIGDKTLSYCGFKKFHPHDSTSTVRIAFETASDKATAKQYLRIACLEAQAVFKRIGALF